jgi:hypothetical protein
VLSGAMISLWVGCWRSQVPSVYSPECVEVEFCELRYEVVVDHPFGGCGPAL